MNLIGHAWAGDHGAGALCAILNDAGGAKKLTFSDQRLGRSLGVADREIRALPPNRPLREHEMDSLSAASLRSYTCLLLDVELKLVRTVVLAAYTDAEAIDMASDLLIASPAGSPVVGFDLRNDGAANLVPSRERAGPAAARGFANPVPRQSHAH